ncbi:hypothetical protein IKT18_00910 [Candidatus Saccharibacteria bacterium]|nr:hypothetical protein [Candidatus Saccharibacteria bacterium]
MANFLDKIKNIGKGKSNATRPSGAKPGTINLPSFNQIKTNIQDKINKHPAGREINLVPDIKDEMIKALKLRNFIFFLCIIIASASVAVSLIFATIAVGQQAIVDAKNTTISNLSSTVNSYSDLGDFLTIKDQLNNLDTISKNKKLLSRTFSVLSALLPTGADYIKISELGVNFTGENPIISFDAQANAGNPPYIDYNVLDSFKKSMQYMRYDYGSYVDRYGVEIPAYCIIENGTDGASLYDEEKGSYAYWLIKGEGCNPSYEPELDKDGEEIYNETKALEGYVLEDYGDDEVVRIWRTPQYKDWYKEKEVEGQPYMSIDGEITNVAHFASECTTYYGIESEKNKEIVWKTENEDCLLVPDGIDGIKISDSSNGRGATGELVLRFSASITLNSEVFSATNHHLIAVAPLGRHNVTDSYVQIQNMFSERAADCEPGDTACNSSTNGGN